MAAEPFRYLAPVTLARFRAERARAAGQASPALWGSLGCLVTLDKHGREHFARMARRRWGQ